MSETTRSERPPWKLWAGQIAAIVRLELRKNLLGRRSLPVYFLAALPILFLGIVAILPIDKLEEGYNLALAREAFAYAYQWFILPAVVFFGCVFIFTNLFRGEVLDRSLHYYLLAPVRRPVLVVGKYVSGLLTTAFLFLSTTLISYLLMYSHFGFARAVEDLTTGIGGRQLLAYLFVTLLGCVGYGTVFLIVGLVFRNPILPAAGILGWEGINFLLPPMLKKLSVIHYIKGLCPVPISLGPFAVYVEPPPVWMSVTGLMLFTVAVLALSSLVLFRFEINYGED